MRSPTLIGRSTRRIRPETKLLMMDCSPKPMPTDSAPATMATFCKLRPTYDSAIRDGENDAGITRAGADRTANADIEISFRQETLLKPSLERSRSHDTANENSNRTKDRGRRNGDAADVEAEERRRHRGDDVVGTNSPCREDKKGCKSDQGQLDEATEHRSDLADRAAPEAGGLPQKSADRAIKSERRIDENRQEPAKKYEAHERDDQHDHFERNEPAKCDISSERPDKGGRGRHPANRNQQAPRRSFADEGGVASFTLRWRPQRAARP